MTEPRSAKDELRRAAALRRGEAASAAAADTPDVLAATGLKIMHERAPGTVSGFWPIRDEIDVRPLLAGLRKVGWTVALPVVAVAEGPLQFRVWSPADVLVRARFGVMEPASGEIVAPDVLLVPLLAFDRRGHRLGYGKGHYDMTLDPLRRRGPVLAVGVGYALQEVPAVPFDDHDQRLDAVLTEREWIWIGANG